MRSGGRRRSSAPCDQHRRPADYCFDPGASTKAASTRCACGDKEDARRPASMDLLSGGCGTPDDARDYRGAEVRCVRWRPDDADIRHVRRSNSHPGLWGFRHPRDDDDVAILKAVNLAALKFALELAAIAAFTYWGATVDGGVVSVLLAVIAPAVAVVLWGGLCGAAVEAEASARRTRAVRAGGVLLGGSRAVCGRRSPHRAHVRRARGRQRGPDHGLPPVGAMTDRTAIATRLARERFAASAAAVSVPVLSSGSRHNPPVAHPETFRRERARAARW